LWLKHSFDVRFSSFSKKGWHRKSEISARVGYNFYGWYNGGKISIFAWDDDQDWVLSPAKSLILDFRFQVAWGFTISVLITMKNGYHGNTM